MRAHRNSALAALGFLLVSAPAMAERVGSYTYNYNWKCVGLCNDKIAIESFKDPKVDGVVCHMSRAVNGSWLPTAEDPSDNSLACRQNGPINADLSALKGSDGEEVFSQKTSMVFKSSSVHRYIDVPNKTIIYLTVSTKLFEGSPKNSISSVPVMPWGR